VGKLVGGGLLVLLSLFMFVGFLSSGVSIAAPATIAALLITVGLPAAAGVALASSQLRRRGQLARRRDELRQQTIESEILRLAGRHRGRLTAVEVASEMAISPEGAKEALDSLVMREMAELEITESGTLVYAFGDIRNLPQKSRAKGILDA
jgi:hypothetical protein